MNSEDVSIARLNELAERIAKLEKKVKWLERTIDEILEELE